MGGLLARVPVKNIYVLGIRSVDSDGYKWTFWIERLECNRIFLEF